MNNTEASNRLTQEEIHNLEERARATRSFQQTPFLTLRLSSQSSLPSLVAFHVELKSMDNGAEDMELRYGKVETKYGMMLQ